MSTAPRGHQREPAPLRRASGHASGLPSGHVPHHDIIVIGASAGGVEALVALVGGLPRDLPAAVFVTLHIPPYAHSYLPEILQRAGRLPAAQAVDQQLFEDGHIYTAPPDHHLLVERGRMRVARGPRENRSRPAIDPLFRSAAFAYGPRVIGVILSGALDDGTAGLLAIKRQGGMALAQEPTDALIPSMPTHALRFVTVDHTARAVEMGPLLGHLAEQPALSMPEGDFAMARDLERETQIAAGDKRLIGAVPPGDLTTFACPDYGGPLWELRDGELLRYRCRNGHAFTSETMLEGAAAQVEEALWEALNTLESSALVSERLANDARDRGHSAVAERMDEKATLTRQRANLIRTTLLNVGAAADPAGGAPVDGEGAPGVALKE